MPNIRLAVGNIYTNENSILTHKNANYAGYRFCKPSYLACLILTTHKTKDASVTK